MRVALIGRHQTLLACAKNLVENGHQIVGILAATEAPEYSVGLRDFSNLADVLGVPFQVSRASEENHCFLLGLDAQVGVSVNFPTLLPRKTLELFSFGVLNAHGGDLPKYRGNASQAWAILNGEERIGLCVHKMAEQLDSGDILARSYLSVNQSTLVGEVLAWMEEVSPVLMAEAVSQLEQNPDFILEKQSTNPQDSLRCFPRQPSDGKIIWSQSSVEVLRLVKASSHPFLGAFTYLSDEKVVVWDAEIVTDMEPYMAVPGQVLIPGLRPVVSCGSGTIRLTQIDRESGKEGVGSIRQRFS
jgi:methionyl-tRNA formyltransferase